jgi:hypothetical protein
MCGDSSQVLNRERLLEEVKPDLVLTDPPFDKEATDLVRSVILACGSRAVVMTAQGQAFSLCNDELEFRMDFVWIHGAPRSIGAANLPLFYHVSLVFVAKPGVVLGWNRPDINSGSVLWDGTGGYDFTSFGQAKHDSPFREILRGFDKVKTVIDPFMGSGSTLIACEKLHRTFFGMELDPLHFSVCLERLFKWGLRPTKLS